MDVEDRRVGLEQAGRPLLGVEPVAVDPRDERLLLVQLGFLLDDRGHGDDLVEVQPAILGDRHPVRSDIRRELVEHQPDELLRRRVREDPIGRRPEEALERGALRRVLERSRQPGIVGEQLGRRRLRDLVELGRVHLERGQRLELGRHLLEAKAGPQGDVDERDGRRLEQGDDQLVGGHVLAQDEGAGLERAGQAVCRGDEDERAVIREQPLALEAHRDGLGRVARFDQELDLRGIRRRRRGQGRAQVLAHDVRHERQLEHRRVVVRHGHHGRADRGSQGGQGDRQDDRGEDQREDQELEEADQPATPAPAAALARDRLRELGDRVGRVGVWIVRGGRGRAAVPGASAGADRHRWFSWGSGGRGMDERRPARVSSSSWRMMAAASRSTRAR